LSVYGAFITFYGDFHAGNVIIETKGATLRIIALYGDDILFTRATMTAWLDYLCYQLANKAGECLKGTKCLDGLH